MSFWVHFFENFLAVMSISGVIFGGGCPSPRDSGDVAEGVVVVVAAAVAVAVVVAVDISAWICAGVWRRWWWWQWWWRWW